MPGWRGRSRGHGAGAEVLEQRARCWCGGVGVGSTGSWQKAPRRGGGISEGLGAEDSMLGCRARGRGLGAGARSRLPAIVPGAPAAAISAARGRRQQRRGSGMPLPAEEGAVAAAPRSRRPLHFLSRPSRRRSDGRAALGGPGREVESARPPPALPPLSATAAAAPAPARAAGGRDAPALPGGAGTLPQCRGRGRSSQPEGGDAACACPALLPPREMNMSLPGRVSCSMLNCFVSAAFYSPSLLHGSGAVRRLRSPAHMPVEASCGCAQGEGGSPSPRSHTPPEDTAARPCCPGRAQGHSSARRRGPSPGRPRSLCWAPQAPRLAWSWKITVREQPTPGELRTPPWLRACRTLRCCCCAERGSCPRRLLYLQGEGVSCRPTLSPPGHSWPNGLRGLREACEESGVLTPALPVPGLGPWLEGMLSLCPPCAAGEEGLKDTHAGGELRLPCSSSCCSLGFLCELQSDEGRGSLLPGCCTGTRVGTHLPFVLSGLVPHSE